MTASSTSCAPPAGIALAVLTKSPLARPRKVLADSACRDLSTT